MAEGARAEPPPRTEQQLAPVAARDLDVFLRAGAGTGKTQVLVDRFCAAALEPDAGVERVLAFTFTEPAAAQLRRRVRAELALRAERASGPERESLRAAQDASARAWISTIHGFCRRLLAAHPAAAGIDPRFRVLDEPESGRLATRAFDAALEELVGGGDPEALELAAANNPRMLLAMTRGAYDELRSHGRAAPALPEPPPVDFAAALAGLAGAAADAYQECAGAKKANELESRARIGAAAELDPAAEPSAELLERLRGLELTSNSEHFKGDACERYRRSLKLARSGVASRVLAPAYGQLRLLVEGFGRHYERLKAGRSALDFEDLQLRAVALLAGSDPIRGRYREQFRHLMVDEFQDTNELQLRLIGELRGPETRLFVVGDEFQSIYGFRHADIGVYRREHERFASGAEPNGRALPLTGNFRAAAEIVAATNSIGEALLDGFEPLTAAAEGGAEASEGDGGGEPVVELLLTKGDGKGWEAAETGLPMLEDDPSAAPNVAEARLLAARLRELVDAGEDPAEIVVLLRAFTHVNTIERALGEAGLDPYVVGGRGFWSQQQIEDLRCLLAVVDNPLRDEALFGALASPACAVLPDTLWLLRRAAIRTGMDGRPHAAHVWPLIRELAENGAPREGEGDAEAAALIAGEERERLLGFAATVEQLRARGAEGGLEALVERVATSFDYDLATLGRDGGPARWANARKLMRIAREFSSREGPDLSAFLEYLDTRAAQRDREAPAATRAEGHAGVRVMTIHAAKGLEFGVVAVADLGRSLKFGWTPLRVAPGDEAGDGEATRVGVQLGRLGRPGERLYDYEELTELVTEREAEEEGRLAYVAATRAKRRLLLSGTYSPGKPRAGPIRRKPISQQLIRSLLDGDLSEREVEVPPLGDGPGGRLRVRVSSPEPGAGAAMLRERTPEPVAGDVNGGAPPLGRPPTPPALIGGLSYSALSEFSRCGYRFYVERALGVSQPAEPATPEDGGEAASPQARRRFGPGLAVHALLEWSARNGWRQPGAERVAAALRDQDLEADEGACEQAAGRVAAWLGSSLRGELDGARLGAEVPFVLSVGETLLRGEIDLLAERPDGSVLVVDYKTDRLRGRDPAEAARRYEVQRDLYALAAASRGAPVETAYVFLESPGSPVRESHGPGDLGAARKRVEELLAQLSAGEFEVSRHPHLALCHECPAAERLCSHGVGHRTRGSGEPAVEPGGTGPEATGPAEDPDRGPAGPQMSLLD